MSRGWLSLFAMANRHASFIAILILVSFKWVTCISKDTATCLMIMVRTGSSMARTPASPRSQNTKAPTTGQSRIATLEKERLDRLSPGVVQPYLREDIHSTNAVQGPGVVFRFLSYDLDKIERNRYNMEKSTITRLTPQ
jgi:hypothetical protein